MANRSAEQSIETIRRGAEACERAMGITTERDLVRALIDALCPCQRCGDRRPSTKVERDGYYCDAHAGTHAFDLPWAPALRALTERMKAWDAPMPGAGEALLAGEGGE